MYFLILTTIEAQKLLASLPEFNKIYSDCYNAYFPDQTEVFRKSEKKLSGIEKKYKSHMITALTKNGKFNMKKYYQLIPNLFPDYGVREMYVIFLFEDKKLIGGCNFSISMNGMDTTLTDLFVVKQFRGKGLAKFITKFVINHANEKAKHNSLNKILLEVDTNNIPAIKAYTACGFKTLVSFDNNKTKMEYSLKF